MSEIVTLQPQGSKIATTIAETSHFINHMCCAVMSSLPVRLCLCWARPTRHHGTDQEVTKLSILLAVKVRIIEEVDCNELLKGV